MVSVWTINHRENIGPRDVIRDERLSRIIAYQQPSGAYIDFEYPKEFKKEKIDLELIVPKGLTNGGSRLSGRTNIKNLKLLYRAKEDNMISVDGSGHIGTLKKAGLRYDGLFTCEKSLDKVQWLHL